MECQKLDRVLEAAVVLTWPELMPDDDCALVHVEYDFDSEHNIDFLQIWSSKKRGIWRLICTCSMARYEITKSSVQFQNGYASQQLEQILDRVMRHQDLFVLPHNPGRQGLIQIAAPTEEQRRAAAVSVKEALDAVKDSREEFALV